jgi:hypothetical protein
MSKFIWLAFAGLALFVGVMGAVASMTSYSYPHPSGEKLVVTKNRSVMTEQTLLAKSQLAEAMRKGLHPKAVTEETEHDFGTMNPRTVASHTFVIRNEGEAPLQLTNGGTTCKCTLSKLSGGFVPPGGEGHVTLTWNSGLEHAAYEHGATIVTNDPQRSAIQLKLRGTVLTRLAPTRAELSFAAVEPDRPATLETTVFSQFYSSLKIEKGNCSIPGVTWQIAPAPPQQQEELKALAASVVSVTVPGDLPSGRFSGVLRLDIVAETDASVLEHETIELPINGQVVRRLSLYGEGIDEAGLVDFGVIDEGAGKRLRFLMKVRDSQREIAVKRVDVRPEFVKVSVLPYGAGDTPGMYYLDLEVPPDAPQCVHVGKRTGKLRIEFDHPRIGELELKLGVAVAPSGS